MRLMSQLLWSKMVEVKWVVCERGSRKEMDEMDVFELQKILERFRITVPKDFKYKYIIWIYMQSV